MCSAACPISHMGDNNTLGKNINNEKELEMPDHNAVCGYRPTTKM